VRVVGDIYDRRYYASEVAPLLEPDQSVESLPRAELMRLMSRAAVVLMPVRWEEAFGLVAAEAQMAGCPVVGFRRGALPEVVDEGVGGFLVEPENEAALVPAIHAALRLDRTGIRDHALTTFGVGRMVDEYERALAAIIFECTAGSSLPLR
jgi:glycosyltransferase involved in cell wall biosynthesis